MSLGDVVPLSLQPGLVALSFVIAFLGAYVALSAAARIRLSVQYGDNWQGFVLLGALAMGGIGLWGMHFIGMQAQNLPFEVTYSLWPTLLSALVAICFSAAAFFYVGAGLSLWPAVWWRGGGGLSAWPWRPCITSA